MEDEKTVILKVNGMSCQHCREAVENVLKILIGVKGAEVNLVRKTAPITFDPDQVNTG
jgi:copper chaperone